MGRGCTFDTQSSIITPIFGYGCWCNFGDMFGKGGGKPVDALDRSCKQLQKCVQSDCLKFNKPSLSQNYNTIVKFWHVALPSMTMKTVTNASLEQLNSTQNSSHIFKSLLVAKF